MSWILFLFLNQPFANHVIQTPLPELKVSSSFGLRNHPIKKTIKFHEGVDLVAKRGSPILSVSSGRVIFASSFGGYGNLIVVRHTDRLTTHYGHCEEIHVNVGQYVSAGETLGTVGETGAVTGPHLHFEIRYDGKAQEPMGVLK